MCDLAEVGDLLCGLECYKGATLLRSNRLCYGVISLSVSILEKSLTFMVARGTLLLIKVLLLFQIELIVFIRHYRAVE